MSMLLGDWCRLCRQTFGFLGEPLAWPVRCSPKRELRQDVEGNADV